MRTIKEQWSDYEAQVLPSNASPTQRRETRRAFYGGVVAAVFVLQAAADDHDDAQVVLDAMEDELLAFMREVSSGRA